MGSSKAVFSPLSIIPLLDQLHHVSALHREILSAVLLIVSHHCVFAGTLFKVKMRKQKSQQKSYTDMVFCYEWTNQSTRVNFKAALINISALNIGQITICDVNGVVHI